MSFLQQIKKKCVNLPQKHLTDEFAMKILRWIYRLLLLDFILDFFRPSDDCSLHNHCHCHDNGLWSSHDGYPGYRDDGYLGDYNGNFYDTFDDFDDLDGDF